MFLVTSPNRMTGYGPLHNQAMGFFCCSHTFQRRPHSQCRSNRLHDESMVVGGRSSACCDSYPFRSSVLLESTMCLRFLSWIVKQLPLLCVLFEAFIA